MAVVIDPGAGVTRLYHNGALVGSTTLPPELRPHLVSGLGLLDVNNFLGRSQTDADPLFNGRITEFRVYNGAMSDAAARQSYLCGPDQPDGCEVAVPPSLSIERTGTDVTIAWPEDALGYDLYGIDGLGGDLPWAPVDQEPVISEGVKTTTIAPGGRSQFFRLQKLE